MKTSWAVIITLLASTILSVDAIKCHQCNSHMNDDCIHLRLNTPRAQRDNQYLRDCDGPTSSVAFCRKTVITIEATTEHRIVRSCGWIADDTEGRNISCFSADNEGFLQTICSCYEDGCNGGRRTGSEWSVVQMVAILCSGLLLATVLRHSG